MDGRMKERLKSALLLKFQQNERIIEQEQVESIEISTPEPEMGDLAHNLEQINRVEMLVKQEKKEMEAIQNALLKMTQGRFGVCEECGKNIPSKRLRVLPDARLCIICQTEEEKRNKLRIA